LIPGGVFVMLYILHVLHLYGTGLWHDFRSLSILFSNRLGLRFINGLSPVFLIVYIIMVDNFIKDIIVKMSGTGRDFFRKVVFKVDMSDPLILVGRISLTYFIALVLIVPLFKDMLVNSIGYMRAPGSVFHFAITLYSLVLGWAEESSLLSLIIGVASWGIGLWSYLGMLYYVAGVRGLDVNPASIVKSLIILFLIVLIESFLIAFFYLSALVSGAMTFYTIKLAGVS
ncbi:MAG: hypothetical protein F7C35_08010, partial [Desulfurococcales archaeon]|nr:hypothetical protein [Desulfurococcales archaeon]